jgi:hypothetical protein
MQAHVMTPVVIIDLMVFTLISLSFELVASNWSAEDDGAYACLDLATTRKKNAVHHQRGGEGSHSIRHLGCAERRQARSVASQRTADQTLLN